MGRRTEWFLRDDSLGLRANSMTAAASDSAIAIRQRAQTQMPQPEQRKVGKVLERCEGVSGQSVN
jgi:hypothetical protein